MSAARLFPLQAGGAAEDAALLLGRRGGLAIEDRTAWPRWGLKGPGSADWLAAAGLALPEINRWSESDGIRILRLGRNDVTLLADPDAAERLAAIRVRWEAAAAPKGYPSWREEGWAWLALSGAGLAAALARLTAVDLRPGRFGADAIAQTRVAHLDAVLLLAGGVAEILFDIAASAGVVREIARAAEAGRP
jgi:sarcosine oxidase subunit gamma